MDKQMIGCMDDDDKMDGRMDRLMDQWIDGWIDGWLIDGYFYIFKC